MDNKSFSFAETFPPQLIYLSEILELAKNNYVGDKYDISNITGIPTGKQSGKVLPHMKYLGYMGAINYLLDKEKIKLSLTDLGQIIYDNDNFLTLDITKMILHYNLNRINKGAIQWSYVFRKYPYEFNKRIPIVTITDRAKLEYGKNLDFGSIKSTYNNGDFFSISPVDFIDKDIIFKSNYLSYEYIGVYGYTLLKELEENFIDDNEVTIHNIMDDIRWNKGFGFNYETTIEALDELTIKGYIKLNKQLNPITIIRIAKSKDVINEIYDDLI